MSTSSIEEKIDPDEIIEILRVRDAPMHTSDIRLAISGRRPGVIELERELLKHDDLFVFQEADRVELTQLAKSRKAGIDPSKSAFDVPEAKDLLAYYEECVREDGRRIRVYGSHLGVSAIATESEWVSDARGVYSIPVTSEYRDLILNSSDGATAHYYGYPVLAQWVDEESTMKFVPILFWRLEKLGDGNESSHRLSFTLSANDFRLNPEALWGLPVKLRQRIVDLFQNTQTLAECLEMMQADFLGFEIREVLFQRRLPKNPRLEDLGKRDEGIYNRGLYLAITPSSYVKGLARDLSLLADAFSSDSMDSSIDALLQVDSRVCMENKVTVVPGSRTLNAYQEAAVERSFANRLSVVTGPPGTGKSEVVVAIVVNAFLHGRSVLFASKNNGAITVVENRINALLGERIGVLRLGRDYDSATKKKVHELFSQPIRRELSSAKIAAGEYDESLAELEETISLIHQYEVLSDKANEAEKSYLNSLSNLGISPSDRLPNQFTESVNEELETIIGLIQNCEKFERVPLCGSYLYKKRISVIINKYSREIARLEELFYLEKGAIFELHKSDRRKWSRIVLNFLEVCERARLALSTAKELESLGDLEGLFRKLADSKEALSEKTTEKIEILFNNTLQETSREQGFQQGSQQFLDSIGKQHESRVHLEHPMQNVLRVLPCWAVSNLSASGRLPLTPGLFDMVVIDEASQCDIPSCMPLMFRAKQAVIIGDPMQLSQITNLSAQSEKSILNRHGIEYPGSFRYSGNSIYDLAFASAPSHARTFLAQHYRCHPEIIEFANSSHWYNSNLEPVTDVESLKYSSHLKLGISWLEVEGTANIGETGYWIPEEANRISDEVYRLLIDERFEGTVGVVTPFRRMANALQEKIESSGVHHSILESCKFRADTAHKFQGDERDIIFYAPCFHPNMPNRHKWFLSSQKNVFNVALSRARSAFVVVGSKEGLRTCEIDYLEDFVGYSEELDNSTVNRRNLDSVPRGHWEPIFEKRLLDAGLPIKSQVPLGPYYLDFALVKDERQLDIEVDGEQFHKNESGMRCQKDIDRNIYVKSQGWSVMRFWVYQLRDDIDGCVKQVEQWWTEKN